MKKRILTVAILGVLTTSSVLSEEFSGARIGLGLSQTDIEAEFKGNSVLDTSYGEGYKFDYGYDFNQIVGLGFSYETNEDTLNGVNFDGGTLKLTTDLGYAFSIQSVYLKPYVKLGYQFYAEESNFNYYPYNAELIDNGLLYGAGLRFQYSHFYADITFDYFSINDPFLDYNMTQTGVILGYKF